MLQHRHIHTYTHIPVYLNSSSPSSHSLPLSWSLWAPTTPNWLLACSGPLWEMSSWRLLSGPPPGPTSNRNQATRQVRGTQVSGVWLERKRLCIQSVSFWPRSSIAEHRGRLGLHEAFPVSPDGLPAAVRRRHLPACRSGYCTFIAFGYMRV